MSLTPLIPTDPNTTALLPLIAPTPVAPAPVAPKLDSSLAPQIGGAMTKLPPLAPPPTPDVSGMAAGASLPAIPPPLRPLVINGSPRAQQEQLLQSRISGYENPDPAKPGFWHKLGHIAARIGNIAGDVIDPNAMELIPGTDLHRAIAHAGDVRELAGLQGQDLAEQNDASRRTLEGEQAAALANQPQQQREQLNAQLAEHGLQIGDDGTIAPVSPENLSPAIRAQMMGGTPEMATYRQLTQIGMSPSDALKEISKDKALALRPPNMEARTLKLPNGQQVAGKSDAQGNLLLENGQPAPAGTTIYQQPNYGMMMLPTKTATYIDPNTNLPTEYQWNAQTQRYDIPVGVSASNAYGHEMEQAAAVERAGENVIADLEANKDKLGTLGAWIAKKGLNTPIADPTLQSIQAELSSFAALNPAMHGAKGAQAMEHFEKLIGGLQQNPEATIAGIRAIMHTAAAINPGVKENAEGSAAGGGAGNGIVYDAKGVAHRYEGTGDRSDPNNYEVVKQ